MHFLMGGFFFLLQEEQVRYPSGMGDFFLLLFQPLEKKNRLILLFTHLSRVIFIHILTLL